MRGNSHVRFGAGDGETCLGKRGKALHPYSTRARSALSLSLRRNGHASRGSKIGSGRIRCCA